MELIYHLSLCSTHILASLCTLASFSMTSDTPTPCIENRRDKGHWKFQTCIIPALLFKRKREYFSLCKILGKNSDWLVLNNKPLIYQILIVKA